jgi:4-hydroxymandelate oxidase
VAVERWAEQLEDLARDALPEGLHRYIRQGARDGVSAAEAVAAWDTFRFVPGVLRDVTAVECSTELLGTPVRAPIALAPTTLQRAAHPDGEVATARAAAAAGSLMVVSSDAGCTFEEIAAAGVRWWLQVYVPSDRLVCLPLLERAVAAGASAVVLTADTPAVGTFSADGGDPVREATASGWLRANYPEGYGELPGHEKAKDLGPHDIDWLRKTTGLPVVVKGVLRPADARRCVDAGAAGVWVSNHGGRQLDGAAATASCLASVAASVAGEAEVYVDGGVRNARHVLTALALGARAVFVGRPALYALAVEGAGGVTRLLDGLSEELVEAMRLAGCNRLASVDGELLAPR